MSADRQHRLHRSAWRHRIAQPLFCGEGRRGGINALARGGTRPRRHHRELYLSGTDHNGNDGADQGRAQGDLCQTQNRARPLRRPRGGRPYDAEPVPAGGLVPDRRDHPGRRRPDGAQRLSTGMRPDALTSHCQGVVFHENGAEQPLVTIRRNAMTVLIRQLHPHFFGEVSGVDLRKTLTPQEAADIEAGMDKYAVLLFRDQDITDEQQLAFALNFGEREKARGGTVTKKEDYRLNSGLNDVSNLGKDGNPLPRDHRTHLFNLGNCLWHSDSSFRPIPAKFSLLSARVVNPKGGNTEFADMRAAYDALDDETKAEIENLICEHSLMYSRGSLGFLDYSEEEKERFKPVRQRLVRTHPSTGRKSLYLASHAGAIVGWPVPEARAFLRDLVEHATQPRFVYAHTWRVRDLVMWDNRRTMHRARPFPAHEPRDMRRTTLAGDAPTAAQVGAATS